MKWQDHAIVLSLQPYGEKSAILRTLTHRHGHCSGFIFNTQKQRALFQPGTLVNAIWKARLREHLGSFKCELIRAYPGEFFTDPKRLTVLSLMCAMIDNICISHEEQPEIFERFIAMLEVLSNNPPEWPRFYVEWEVFLLSVSGFGPQLTSHGTRYYAENDAGGRLPVPPFLLGAPYRGKRDLIDGLTLTGVLLSTHFFKTKRSIQIQRDLLLRLLTL